MKRSCSMIAILCIAIFLSKIQCQTTSSDIFTYGCYPFQRDIYALDCYFTNSDSDYNNIINGTLAFEMDWRIEPKLERNDVEGVSLSESWMLQMNSFIITYFEIIFLSVFYFQLKLHFIPLQWELLKFTFEKNFKTGIQSIILQQYVIGILCGNVISRFVMMELFTTITQNVNQCGLSLIELAQYFSGTNDQLIDIGECVFTYADDATIQIPENPWFTLADTGDINILNMCSGRST